MYTYQYKSKYQYNQEHIGVEKSFQPLVDPSYCHLILAR